MLSNHLILCRPLLLLPTIPPSIRVFSNESTLLMRRPKYWSFSLSVSPSNEYPGLISFRMDWLISLESKGLSRVYSSTTVQKHQFFSAQPPLRSNSHIHIWLLGKQELWPVRYKRLLLDPPENMQVNTMPGVLEPGRNVVLELMQTSCPDMWFENVAPSHLLNGPSREK